MLDTRTGSGVGGGDHTDKGTSGRCLSRTHREAEGVWREEKQILKGVTGQNKGDRSENRRYQEQFPDSFVG